MDGGTIFLLSLATYITGVMVTARHMHIKCARAWMRWKNEAPEQFVNGGNRFSGDRRDAPLAVFIKHSHSWNGGKEVLPRGFAFVWPFFAPCLVIKKVCFPEVKIPDMAKVKELEKL